MKKNAILLLFILLFQYAFTQNSKPYVLGFETTENISVTKDKLLANLEQNEIKIVGQYQPADDNNRWIIVISSSELEDAVKTVGGITGFAAILRIGITVENEKTIVSYTNPNYWGNAYFRDDFDKVSMNYVTLTEHLESAMQASGIFKGTPFGSEQGLSVKDLRRYHYMLGMPYFDDTIELEDFDNYQSALTKIESSIKEGVPNVKMVYKVSIPCKDLTLYGFALSGENGENKFLPIIDISTPKHTAFLPYELLVIGDEVHMLHGRFRIALSFPDLTMGTFTKIMTTPGNIEDLLEQLVD